MAEQSAVLKAVVEVLNDGATGYKDIGEHIKDPGMKAFFLKESVSRAAFAKELEAATGISFDTGGTAAGAIHRTWGNLKANLGGGDHTLLETAEQGEDAAKKAYKEALEDPSVSGVVRSLLQTQQATILKSHDQVKAFRNATAS